jgi:hypothetical protein
MCQPKPSPRRTGRPRPGVQRNDGWMGSRTGRSASSSSRGALAISAEVLSPAHVGDTVGRGLPVGTDYSRRGHRLAGDAPQDDICTRCSLEAWPTGGRSRHAHQCPAFICHHDLLGQVDVNPAAADWCIYGWYRSARHIHRPYFCAVDKRVVVQLCPGGIVGYDLVALDPGPDDQRTARRKLSDNWRVRPGRRPHVRTVDDYLCPRAAGCGQRRRHSHSREFGPIDKGGRARVRIANLDQWTRGWSKGLEDRRGWSNPERQRAANVGPQRRVCHRRQAGRQCWWD